MRSDDFSGEAEVTLYLSATPQVYADPDAFNISSRSAAPGIFRIETSDDRLRHIFSREQAYVGLKVRFFSPADSVEATVDLTINRFTVLLSGLQDKY